MANEKKIDLNDVIEILKSATINIHPKIDFAGEKQIELSPEEKEKEIEFQKQWDAEEKKNRVKKLYYDIVSRNPHINFFEAIQIAFNAHEYFEIIGYQKMSETEDCK